jgi:hypothetical protein
MAGNTARSKVKMALRATLDLMGTSNVLECLNAKTSVVPGIGRQGTFGLLGTGIR